MPNLDTLNDSIYQQIGAPASQSTIYSDTKYASIQLNLDPETVQNRNFNTISGVTTGTYRFQEGFYGLTDMPAEFQKQWSTHY